MIPPAFDTKFKVHTLVIALDGMLSTIKQTEKNEFL
jgi:hypothetical protein